MCLAQTWHGIVAQCRSELAVGPPRRAADRMVSALVWTARPNYVRLVMPVGLRRAIRSASRPNLLDSPAVLRCPPGSTCQCSMSEPIVDGSQVGELGLAKSRRGHSVWILRNITRAPRLRFRCLLTRSETWKENFAREAGDLPRARCSQ